MSKKTLAKIFDKQKYVIFKGINSLCGRLGLMFSSYIRPLIDETYLNVISSRYFYDI